MHSQPITNVLNTVQKCSRSPNNKKYEIIVKGRQSPPPPQEKDHRKRKRRVAFDDQVRVVGMHTRTEYTDDEVRACWYSPSELKLIRSRTAFFKNNHGGEDHCPRGVDELKTLRSKVDARLKGLSDDAEAASNHGRNVCSSRIVRPWKIWLFQQKVAPEMSIKSSESNAKSKKTPSCSRTSISI
jgi:hypothetical protein